MINEALNKLLLGVDLDEIMTLEVFDEILSGLADITTASSFITALKIKGETILELFEAITSARNSINKINFDYNCENLIENIFLNAPSDIIDISFTNDLICAANGLGAVKYSFNSPFYLNNSFNTLSAFGVDLTDKNETFKNEFEILNFAYMFLQNDEPYCKYSFEISRKLPFTNIFNLIDKMLNPSGALNQMIGINNKTQIQSFSNLCLKLRNLNTVVVSGANNLPYITPQGETLVAEAWKDKVFTYSLTPDLLGFETYSTDEIKYENSEHATQILLDVFQNKSNGAAYSTIIMNSALALYIAKKADSILDGLELAKKTIDSGLALHKLEQIKNTLSV